MVNTVKGYAKHENEVFTHIADARSKLAGSINNGDVKAIQQSNDELNSALSRLLVVVENYPTLKADKSFIGLQDLLHKKIRIKKETLNKTLNLNGGNANDMTNKSKTRLVSCSLAIDVPPLFAFSSLSSKANRLRTWLTRAMGFIWDF